MKVERGVFQCDVYYSVLCISVCDVYFSVREACALASMYMAAHTDVAMKAGRHIDVEEEETDEKLAALKVRLPGLSVCPWWLNGFIT